MSPKDALLSCSMQLLGRQLIGPSGRSSRPPHGLSSAPVYQTQLLPELSRTWQGLERDRWPLLLVSPSVEGGSSSNAEVHLVGRSD